MNRRAWNVIPYDKAKALALAQEAGVDEFAVLLLLSRGYDTAEKIRDFVYCEALPFSSPFDIRDMDKAADRIRRAIDGGEKILVYGDYDCDGVTASALLCSYLEAVGADVHCYIPSRLNDGYGLTETGVKHIIDNGYSLVVTVDNGISAINEAKILREHGISLVITDHHKVGSELPDADAVVDPHREDDTCRFKDFAGVGVALKLCAALEDGDSETVTDELGELAALGTIADIVPLTGENRAIVKRGLRQLQNSSRPGINALLASCTGADKTLTSATASFTLAPRINAAGRMDDAKTAFRLLMTDSADEARECAERLCSLNAQRQKTEADIAQSAEKTFEAHPEYKSDRVIVVSGEDLHPGVAGIAAARLTERFSKPAVVISVPESGACRGSCRSIDGLSMYSALDACADLLIQFGGHTLAAGFSIERENIDAFRKRINEYAASVGDIYPTLNIDCRLNPANITPEIFESLDLLEPFGAENPPPVFGLFKMTVTAVKPLGGGKHLRVTLTRGASSVQAVWFNVTESDFPFEVGDTVDAAVRTEKNEFRGKTGVSVQIKDMRPSGCDDRAVFGGTARCDAVVRGERISESGLAELRPDRNYIAKLYKYIKENEPLRITDELLALRIGDLPEHAGKARLCVAALSDAGLISQSADGLRTAKTDRKVDLSQSEILRRTGYSNERNGGARGV